MKTFSLIHTRVRYGYDYINASGVGCLSGYFATSDRDGNRCLASFLEKKNLEFTTLHETFYRLYLGCWKISYAHSIESNRISCLVFSVHKWASLFYYIGGIWFLGETKQKTANLITSLRCLLVISGGIVLGI